MIKYEEKKIENKVKSLTYFHEFWCPFWERYERHPDVGIFFFFLISSVSKIYFFRRRRNFNLDEIKSFYIEIAIFLRTAQSKFNFASLPAAGK